MPEAPPDAERRAALISAAALGGAGCVALAVPYVASWGPSEREKAAGAPVEVDLSTLRPGQMKVIEWRGKPIWILRRTPEMLESLKEDVSQLADPESKRTAYPTPKYVLKDPSTRSIKPEYFIAIGICTHLGCSPSGPFVPGENTQLGTFPGFVCPCHGSTFDLAGRVFKDKPASDNLPVPPHRYVAALRVLIGEDTKA
jgi:ubiquinol-cytochrome c reductase iron-sulfur subunit